MFHSCTTQLLLAVFLVATVSVADAAEDDGESKRPFQVTNDGQLIRPENYRTWVYVGAPLTPNDMNDGAAAFPEFHSVYIDPASYEYYKQTGLWREGTILIKELISVGTKQSSSGSGYFMGDFIGLEASVKSRKHFPNEDGHWAFFSFTVPGGGPLKKQVAPEPSVSCSACHGPAAQQDFVFTQHYPVLRAAKGAGDNPENQ